MTTPSETPRNTHIESERSDLREPDMARDPEEPRSRSYGVTIAWAIFLAIFAIAGVYIIVTLFAIGVQVISDGTPKEQAEEQEQLESPRPAGPDQTAPNP